LFTPFAIWLPRHSSDQVTRGRQVDLSYAPKAERLAYLRDHGRKLLSLVYIGGHVFLYAGNYQRAGKTVVMTYQEMWGLSPKPRIRRAVIGQSVLFPLQLQYPEDPALTSQAAKKYFVVAQLDQMPAESNSLRARINRFILRTMMFPDYF
jgi:hypothetical protein